MHQQLPIRGQNGYARSSEISIMRNQCQLHFFAQLRNHLVIEVRTACGKIVKQLIHIQLFEATLDS